MTRVNFDKTAFNVDVDIDGEKGLFDFNTFIQALSYPFDNTFLLAYEPERNFFVVERTGGVLLAGRDLPEIVWVEENLQNIKNLALTHTQENQFVVTVEMHRNSLLYNTDWMIVRRSEESLANLPYSLSQTQFANLLSYRQALRDITNTYSKDADYSSIVWPILEL